MSVAVASSPPSLVPDVLDPFSFLSTSVGIPTVLAALVYPQVKDLAKRFPRVWKFLSAAVALQLTYQYTHKKIIKLFRYLVRITASSVKIYDNDELLGCFLRWLDTQRPSLTHKEVVTAQSLQYRNTTRNFNSHGDLVSTPEDFDATNFLIQRQYRVRAFRHNGRFFWLTKAADQPDGYNAVDGTAKVKKGLTISTLGGSVKPITSILEAAVRDHSNDGEKEATTLYTPGSNAGGGWDYGDGLAPNCWRKHAVKPCRPLDTVYLDGTQRDMIQHDVARFLHPDTAIRYRSRGIPHRRGYLFHGPPGNGKSSLAMALAGHFGLNVYNISLRDAGINDAYLAQLFTMLPPNKVLVLLEDIDSAGLKREEEFDDDESSIVELDAWGAPYQRGRRPVPRPARATNVTLSGVLNALDGISAPEGHIVVMTTNCPDALDKALIRPGRVDMKVEFKHASHKQLSEMFQRMYVDEQPINESKSTPESTQSTLPAESTQLPTPPRSDHDGEIASDIDEKTEASAKLHQDLFGFPQVPHQLISASKLRKLAAEFAQEIPTGQHSLASVQNYLLGQVDQPHRAIREASQWAADEAREKADYEKRKLERKIKRDLKDEERRRRVKAAQGLVNFNPVVVPEITPEVNAWPEGAVDIAPVKSLEDVLAGS